MGTRSMTYVIDDGDNRVPCLSLYRQFDGYLEGHGQDLSNFLLNRRCPQGWVDKSVIVSADMNDLAAQLTCYLKNDKYHITGNVYLYPITKLPTKKQTFESYRDKYLIPHAISCWCEFVYIIREVNNALEVQIFNYEGECIFVGSPQEMAEKFNLETKDALTEDVKNFNLQEQEDKEAA